jgi:hypothetical protein
VSTDLPWAYLPLAMREGGSASTPVAASVARRAVEVGGAVRLFDGHGRDTAVVSDQISAADGGERWVVLGEDLATFAVKDGDRIDLMRLRIAALGVELTEDGLVPRPQ